MAFAALGTPGSNFVPVAQAQASGTVVGSFLPALNRTVQVVPPTGNPGLDGVAGLPVVGTGSLATVTAADVPTPLPPLTTVTAVPALVVPPSAPTGTGIPGTVLAAYKAAESSLAASDPACHLPWTLVAGIGRVESGNASGGRVDAAGTTRGRILGPLLNGGLGGTAVVRDTDGGSMDGNAQFDRAVGPMQFLPGTWKTYAKDANRDGVADPHNVFDAALATGSYLCAGGSDLSQPIPERAALMRYNHSVAYGDLVLRWAAAYAAGVSALPDSAGEVPSAAPTPPEQVPAPAAGTSSSLAFAAVSSGDSDSTDSTESSESDSPTTSSSSTSTSSTSTSSTSTSTSTSTSSPSTTTSPTTTSPTTTSAASTAPTTPTTTPAPAPPVSSSTEPTTPSTVTTTPPVSTTTRTSTATTTPSRATSSSSTPDPEPAGSDASKSDASKSDASTSDASVSDSSDASKSDTSSAARSSTSKKAATKTTATKTTATKTTATKTTATKTTTKATAKKTDGDTADGDS